MPQHYNETLKKQIVRLRLEEGRSIRSIIEEYGMSKASIINWCNEFREELIYLHDYLAEDDFYASVEEFAYVWYNHVRPHSYNGYKTPFEARTGISNY